MNLFIKTVLHNCCHVNNCYIFFLSSISVCWAEVSHWVPGQTFFSFITALLFLLEANLYPWSQSWVKYILLYLKIFFPTQKLGNFTFNSFFKKCFPGLNFLAYIYLLLEILWFYFCFDLLFFWRSLWVLLSLKKSVFQLFLRDSYMILWNRPNVFFLS